MTCSGGGFWWFNSSYTYDLAGDMTQEHMPSNMTVYNAVDTAQQLTQMTSSLSDGTHPATLGTFTYTPFGGLNTLTDGCVGTSCTSAVETYTYNNRLQPVMIQLSSPNVNDCLVINYYSSGVANPPSACAPPAQGSGDNGTVMGYYYSDPQLGHPNTFSYDALNRLARAQATGSNPANYNWTYTYDRYGNMQCSGSTGGQDTCAALTYNTNTNRLSTIGGQTVQHDAAGNLVQDGTGVGAHAYTWDAEGRMASVSSPPGTTVATYSYNALGQRVERAGSAVPHGGTLDEYYDAFGNRALIISAATTIEDYVPAVGGRDYVKYQNNVTYFLHTNALGSTGTITDQAGNWVGGEIYDPWGQRWGTYGTTYDERYAGMMERDAESGLDPTPNRMFTSQYGRWLSPDPVAGEITNPQSLNLYGYVLNSPTTRIDPPGLDGGYEPECIIDWMAAPCALVGGGESVTPAPPPGHAPIIARGASADCPYCYYNPKTDQTWDPSDNPAVVVVLFAEEAGQPTGTPGGAGANVDYFNLRLTATSDNCDVQGRQIQYTLTTGTAGPVSSPSFYVYEIQSAQFLARGGPFPGTTVSDSFNSFTDRIFPGLSSGTSIQQFGVSLSKPNASGVPGGHLVPIDWSRFGAGFVGQNIIRLSPGNVVVNGKPCH